ncbi:MAG: primosomal replication protein N [Burkholderiaceae bacterium]
MSATLLQRDALRYTPAGVPICQALLEHSSEQSEMGQQRTVRLVIAARFSGPLADRITTESLDTSLSVTGFLCPKKLFQDNKPSGSLQLHVTDFQASNADNHS